MHFSVKKSNFETILFSDILLIMLSFIIVLVGLSVLILVHELGHFVAAKYFGMWVEEFGIGFPPRLFSKRRGETTYSINLVPLGGFVKLHGELEDAGARSFVNQSLGRRAVVLIAGVCMNLIAGWFILSAVFWIGVPPILMIDQVAAGSPAASALVKQGDIIVGWQDPAAFIKFVTDHAGTEITLPLQREGKTLSISVTPRLNPPAGEGALGIGLRGGGVPRQGFFAGLYQGLRASASIVWSIISGLYVIVLAPKNIVGPVGIFSVAISTGQMGFVYLLQLLGLISLNLAVLNLLPIPALDGGRLVFVIIEKLRGKPFGKHIEQRANALGFAFLILLILAVTFKDVVGLL